MEELERMRDRLDNILIAKMMHDYGKPLPGSCFFTPESQYEAVESLFQPALELLFSASVEFEDDDMEETRCITIPVSELMTLREEQKAVLADIVSSFEDPLGELWGEAEVGDDQLQVTINGVWGYSSSVMKCIVRFKKKLDEMMKGVCAENGAHAG
ncbi:hypothetical protein ACFOHW_25150 [Paenibacillus abyssi]